MLGLFGGKNSSKKQVMEVCFSKESQILKEINKVAFRTNDLVEANKIIAEILGKYYTMDNCTIFMYNAGKMNVCHTNVDAKYLQDLEQEVNRIYHEKIANAVESIDAYIIKAEKTLSYKTAEEREIRHMIFIPFILAQVLGGVLIENTSDKLGDLEYEFFQVVIDNITVIIQNLLYFKQIIDSANLDGLTEIYNRYYLNNHLNKQIEIFSEKTGTFSIAMFDIDHFKRFNDTYGHLHGDKVLRSVAQFAKDNVREIDTVYRYGGGEFIIYMPNLDKWEAYKLIDTLREGISKMQIYTDDGKLTQVTASFGIAEFPHTKESLEGLIECADRALYQAKDSGRNRVEMYKF